MKRVPLPIIDGAYKDNTRSFSVQDCVNWLPVNAEQAGTRTPSMLVDCPGLLPVAIVGSGPHRCGINVGGKNLIVSGDHLYLVGTDFSITDLGQIPGSGRVSATANQANQVAFGTGSAGYVLDTSTLTLTQITDSAFPGAILFDYINQLGISLDPSRQYFRNSDINDLSAYSALEKYQGEASPDLLVAVKVCHSELLAFSQTTTEVFDNTTDPTSIADHILFVNKKITIQRGCASSYCVVNLDNSVFFVGDDGGVYRLDGYTPQRISDFPIEQALAKSDLSKCFAFTWEDRGHKVYYLTCPDGQTFGYDVASRQWHRRQSYGLERWRLNTLYEWNGAWYGGSYNDGMLYRLDWDYMFDGTAPHVRKRTTGALHANQNTVLAKSLELVVNTGGVIGISLRVLGDLPDGPMREDVDYSYTVVGGIPPYTLDIESGILPTGLSMDSAGRVTGERSASGVFTWRVRVTDSVGNIAGVDDMSETTVIPEAVTLLSYLFDWYTFDNTLQSAINPTHDWQNGYGGGIAYQPGKKAQELIGANEMRALNGPNAVGVDWSLAFWLDITNTTNCNYHLGLGDSTAFSGTPYSCIEFAYSTGVATAFAFAYDSSVPGYVQTASFAVTGASVFFCLRWVEATKTLTMSINGVDKTPLILGAALSAGMSNIVVFLQNFGSAFDVYTVMPDEWSLYKGHAFTQAEIDYLYNTFSGKSYAEMLADGT